MSLVCTSLLNTLRDIFTEGEVIHWEEQLKFSGKLLKPIVNKVIELKAKVSNLFPFAELLPHNQSQRSLFSYTLYQRQLCRIQGSRVMSFSGVRVDL